MFKSLKAKAQEFMKNLWLTLHPKAKKALMVGIVVVEKMKTYTAHPAVDVITAITPTTLDEHGVKLFREWLPKILITMRLAQNCANESDPQKVVECAVTTLQQTSNDWLEVAEKYNTMDGLAVLISVLVSDGKLDWNDAKYVMKYMYDHYYKNSRALKLAA